MERVSADFYIKIDDQYNIIDIIGRTTIYTPAAGFVPVQGGGIKWYQDKYKSEYIKEEQ